MGLQLDWIMGVIDQIIVGYILIMGIWTFEATKWMLDLPRTHWILGKQSDLGVFEAGIIVPPII
jgi:hypothetical protein